MVMPLLTIIANRGWARLAAINQKFLVFKLRAGVHLKEVGTDRHKIRADWFKNC
jgi:hypothetical protein